MADLPPPPVITIAPKNTTTKKYAWDGNKKVVATDYANSYLNLDKQTQQQIIQYAATLGKKPAQAKTVWGQLVAASSAAYAQGIQKSPLQVMQDELAKQPVTSYQNIQKQTYTADAQASAVNAAYIKILGRIATQDELNNIIKTANTQPGDITQTTYTKGGSVTTRTPDLTPEQIATSQALSAPEYETERKGMQDLGFLSWINNAFQGIGQAGGQSNG